MSSPITSAPSTPTPIGPSLSLKRKQIPSLPIETISLIIKLALPIITPSTFKERYHCLKSFCLVSRKWRLLAQKELFAHIRLKTPQTAFSLLTISLEGEDKRLKELGHSTKTLRIGDEAGNNHFDKYHNLISRVIVRCTNLEAIWICFVSGLDPCMMSWAVNITELHLESVTFRLSKAASTETMHFMWHLPHLTSLFIDSLAHNDFNQNAIPSTDLLNRLSLPKLHTLAYQWGVDTMEPILELIGPHLKSLYLYRIPTDSNEIMVQTTADGAPIARQTYPYLPDMKELSSLRHLAMDFRYKNDITALYDLNCSPSSLRITADSEPATLDFAEAVPLFKDLENGGRVWSKLERVIVPAIPKVRAVGPGRLITREFCKTWEIELKEIKIAPFEDAQEVDQWLRMTNF